MRDRSKRVVASALSLLLSLGLVPAPALAEVAEEAEALTLASADETAVAITTPELTPESRSLTFEVTGLPEGAMCAVKAYDEGVTDYTWSNFDTASTLKVMNAATGAPSEGENKVTWDDALAVGQQVVVLVMTGLSDDAVVAKSAPIVVTAAAVPEPETTVSITTSELTPESRSLSFEVTGLPQGAMCAVRTYDEGATEYTMSAGEPLKIMNANTGLPVEGTNEATWTGALTVGQQVVVLVVTGYSDDDVVAKSAPLAVTAAAEPEPETTVSITTSELTPESRSLSFEVTGLPEGAMCAVKAYDEGVTDYTWSNFDTASTLKVMNAATGAPAEGENKVTWNDALAVGQQVVVLVMTALSDEAIVAKSAPLTVTAATVEPGPATRQQIIDACSVTMDSPHTDGDAAGKFLLSDTQANISVTLHESITFARLSVIAYPKAAAFDPDNASYNKTVFSTMVRDGDSVSVDQVTADFGDKLAALDTTYNLVAYLYFQVPPEEEYDYQYTTSRGFELLDADGQTTQGYTYPKASIVESELPTGATAMHVSLTGDERLFKLARDTQDATALADQYQIHFMVIEYDPSITNFDMGEDTSYTTLYDEYATEAFQNKEIELKEPLTSGRKVRALCYWSQYDGELAPLPVPKGVDYAGRDDEAIVVTDDAAPIVATPVAVVSGPVTSITTAFSVEAKNLPDGALMFVKAFGADEEIVYGYDKGASLATFSPHTGTAPVNGANAVSLENPVAAGNRIVAFVLSGGNVVAQSEPVTVTEATSSSVVAFSADSYTTDTTAVTVNVSGELPDGAALLIKSFEPGDEVGYDKGTPHGWFANAVSGANELTLSFDSGNLVAGYKLVAFLMASGNPVAVSDAAAIVGQPEAPTATIGLDGNDVELTEGDRFVSLAWSVDASTQAASYKLYQYTTDELDVATATVLSSGTLTVSKYNHSGTTSVNLGGKLEADAKLQLVLTADDQEAYSNVMTVGATPDWALVTPTVAFDQAFVRSDAKTVKLVVNYPEEYESLGSEFYCNVSVYLYPGSYTDDDFEDKELDENPSIAHVVAGANSSHAQTRGSLELTFGDAYELTPGSRLIAKIRLPQAERQDHDSMWEDYLSMSIPVVNADSTVPGEHLYVYNLGADTAKGAKLREVAEELGLPLTDLAQADLVRQVGAVVGYDGYDEVDEDYASANPTVEYLLMANLSEASLDRLLAAMSDAGVSVGAKGVTTDTNLQWALGRLVVDIAEEHETMTALVDLQQLVRKAEALDEATYGTAERWTDLQSAIAAARSLYDDDDDDPSAEDLRAAYEVLEEAYLSVSGLVKLDGRVQVTATAREDGTYDLTAAVVNATAEGLSYSYTWSDGSTGATLGGVSADKVGARSVKVAAEGTLGTLEGRIAAPEAPVLIVSANEGRIDVSWPAQEADFNQPAPSSYTVELYSAGSLASTKTTASTSVAFTGLAVGDYEVKAYATNVAGRSDKTTELVTLQTAAPIQLSSAVVTLASTSLVYNGAARKPAVKSVKVNGKTVPASAYTVSYASNKAVGTAKVTVTAKEGSGYTGKKVANFKITALSLAKATVTLKKSKVTYIGKAQKPAIKTVKVGSVSVPASGYTISYLRSGKATTNFKNAGSIVVTIKGKDNFSGTKKVTYTIAKAKATVKATGSTKKVSFATAKKKAVAVKKGVTVKSAKGKLTYANASSTAALKKFKVNAKTGAITVPKGTKKGTYKVKVKVTDAGTTNYAKGTATATVTIKVA